MGNPVCPVIGKYYMETFGKSAIISARNKLTKWYSYVEDTFPKCPHGNDALAIFL